MTGCDLGFDPSLADKNTFVEYLLGSPIRQQDPETNGHIRNHVLVLGYGAGEPRTLRLLDHACSEIRNLQIFWVCYSAQDVVNLQKLDKKEFPHIIPRLKILRHTEPGLLLLQLDQTIRKTLPPAGAIFPSVIRIPLPPMPSPGKRYRSIREACKKFRENLLKQIELFNLPGFWKPHKKRKLVVAYSSSRVTGVTSACAEVFRQLESRYMALWIDMNDVNSTDHLFEILLEAAYHKLSREDWTPVYMGRDQRPRDQEIRSLVDSSDKPWIVFLNARETPGANREDTTGSPNGWLDNTGGPRKTGLAWDDRSSRRSAFVDLLIELCGRVAGRLTVVVLCYSGTPFLGERNAFLKKYGAEMLPFKAGRVRASISSRSVAKDVFEWTKARSAAERRQRQRFVHALVLMQRPRMLAVLWDDCLGVGRAISDPQKERWLDALEERGLVRRKEGGIIWMHTRYRNEVRRLFSQQSSRDEEAQIHAMLARWYVKTQDATGATSAIFEAVDHLAMAARNILQNLNESKQRSGSKAMQALLYLKIARGLLWSNHFLIRSSGHAVSSCRRLLLIRDALGNDQMIRILEGLESKPSGGDSAFEDTILYLRKLLVLVQINCVELIREISRESGEDGKAYQCHREIRARNIRAPEILPLEEVSGLNDKQAYFNSKALADALQMNRMSDLNQDPTDAPQRLWVRWWRNCAALAINTRSFEQAESSLSRALLALRESTPKFDGHRVGRVLPDPPPFRDLENSLHDKGLPLRLEALRVIEKCASLLLLRDSLAYRFFSLDPKAAKAAHRHSAKSHRQTLQKTDRFIKCGLKLAEQICLTDHSRNAHIAGESAWFKAHLLLHRSLVCHALDPRDTSIPKAMGLLDDAQACLTSADNPRNHAAVALVELHRAEIRLRQAFEYPRLPRSKPSRGRQKGIGDWSLKFLDVREDELLENLQRRDKRWTREVQRFFDSRPKVESVVQMKAMDAIRFLDRAEPILHERRRNVWWSTWYFERRLDTIALTLWATVNSKESPIPFLGLEAAADWADTEADTLLKDTLRMVRIDTYRLATVILSYALCTRALQVRMAISRASTRHSHRLETMNRNLRGALVQLNKATKRRKDAVSKDPKFEELKIKDERDQTLLDFVECVRKKSYKLQRSIAHELRKRGTAP